MSLEEFFNRFTAKQKTNTAWKLRDWPDSTSFAQKYPVEYAAFVAMLPWRSHTSPDGFFNIASHYALDLSERKTFRPDLGPKMYLATADHSSQGSTVLHLDVTSALNILVDDGEVATGGGVWTIFGREATPVLRSYLSLKYPKIEADVIHSHQVFLSDDDFVALKELGVRPFRFTQRKGQGVCIPAGCAHQVSNVSSCIKVAVDFTDSSSIATSLQLTQELRADRLSDVLQLRPMLWHAWQSAATRLHEGNKKVEDKPQNLKNNKQHKSVSARNKKEEKAVQRRLALPGNTQSAEEQRFRYKCPMMRCEAITRRYHGGGIFDHLLKAHGLRLSADHRRSLLNEPADTWKETFEAVLESADTAVETR